MLMNIIKTIVLGIVEGITEWLPISSTGHLILLEEFMPLQATAEFKSMFFVVIQLGAILAVCVLFFHKLNPWGVPKKGQTKQNTWQLWLKIIIACVPAAILGLLFDDLLDKYLYNFVTVACMLIIYGVLFIIVENYNKKRSPEIIKFQELTYKQAFFIGGFQTLSLIPGTSRSGATILGGMLLGTSRSIATEFSFFLGIPTMFGASLLKTTKFLTRSEGIAIGEYVLLLLGMLISFLVSVIAIRFLLKYIRRHNFKIFGYYRIVLGIILLVIYVMGR